MLITDVQLKNLPVFTASGKQIGRLEDIVIDTDSQSVLNYLVKPATFLAGLTKGSLIIHRGQIMDITADKLIVQDNFSTLPAFAKLNKILNKEKLIALNKNN